MHYVAQDTLVVRKHNTLYYQEAWILQQELHSARRNKSIPDTVLLLEHHPVITLGTRGGKADLLRDESSIAARGVEIHRSTRGGQATLHAPGQLVAYFICDLHGMERKVRKFVSNIEISIIETLHTYGIDSGSRDEHPGVWTKQGKIASIGIAIKNSVTMHGFALNCSTDLSLFSLLSPCGLSPSDICSMQSVLGAHSTPSLQDLQQRYIDHGLQIFSYNRILQSS